VDEVRAFRSYLVKETFEKLIKHKMIIDLTSYFCLLENFTSSKPGGYSGVKFSAGVELFCQIYFSKVSENETRLLFEEMAFE